MDDRYPEFRKAPFKLAHGFFIFQLILDALLGRGFIRCVLIQMVLPERVWVTTRYSSS
jgi:hypothetical protein